MDVEPAIIPHTALIGPHIFRFEGVALRSLKKLSKTYLKNKFHSDSSQMKHYTKNTIFKKKKLFSFN